MAKEIMLLDETNGQLHPKTTAHAVLDRTRSQDVQTTLDSIMDKLNPFSVSLSGGGVFEAGIALTQKTFNGTVKIGSDNASINDFTLALEDLSSSPSCGDFGNIVRNAGVFSFINSMRLAPTTGSITITANVKRTQNNTVVGTYPASTTIQFVNASYFGVFDKDTDILAALSNPNFFTTFASGKSIKNSRNYTKTFSQTTSQKHFYMYPSSFGELTSITDGHNEYLDSYIKVSPRSVALPTGITETYRIYILKNPAGVSDYTLTFK